MSIKYAAQGKNAYISFKESLESDLDADYKVFKMTIEYKYFKVLIHNMYLIFLSITYGGRKRVVSAAQTKSEK